MKVSQLIAVILGVVVGVLLVVFGLNTLFDWVDRPNEQQVKNQAYLQQLIDKGVVYQTPVGTWGFLDKQAGTVCYYRYIHKGSLMGEPRCVPVSKEQ